jgi:hypothetical protein
MLVVADFFCRQTAKTSTFQIQNENENENSKRRDGKTPLSKLVW